jgi:hypothetical protein
MLDIFNLGYRKDLKIEDLYEALQEHRSDFLGNKLEKYVHNVYLVTVTTGKLSLCPCNIVAMFWKEIHSYIVE